jgi:hypothetical protein
MQTFLPFSTFSASAAALDQVRLFNQYNEALVIYRAVTKVSTAWASHPACDMWRGFAPALAQYRWVILQELKARGKAPRTEAMDSPLVLEDPNVSGVAPYPAWIGYEPFHEAHRCNLARKDKKYLERFKCGTSDIYLWPKQVSKNKWLLRQKRVGANTYLPPAGILTKERKCLPV